MRGEEAFGAGAVLGLGDDVALEVVQLQDHFASIFLDAGQLAADACDLTLPLGAAFFFAVGDRCSRCVVVVDRGRRGAFVAGGDGAGAPFWIIGVFELLFNEPFALLFQLALACYLVVRVVGADQRLATGIGARQRGGVAQGVVLDAFVDQAVCFVVGVALDFFAFARPGALAGALGLAGSLGDAVAFFVVGVEAGGAACARGGFLGFFKAAYLVVEVSLTCEAVRELPPREEPAV